jgi:hypothetical protein
MRQTSNLLLFPRSWSTSAQSARGRRHRARGHPAMRNLPVAPDAALMRSVGACLERRNQWDACRSRCARMRELQPGCHGRARKHAESRTIMSIVPMPRVCRNYDCNVAADGGETNNSNSVYFSNDVRRLPRATAARGHRLGGTRLRCVGAGLQRSHWENAEKKHSNELILLVSAPSVTGCDFTSANIRKDKGIHFGHIQYYCVCLCNRFVVGSWRS